jgi:ribonuclease Z
MSITTDDGLRVEKIWSQAGFATCVHVRGPDKHVNILFDCGMLDPSTLSAKHVFISHGHIDHSGACISHARAKGRNSAPSTYYLPNNCVQPLLDAKAAFEQLDGHEIPMNIVGMDFMSPVKINDNYTVFAFPTLHRVPSQGYGIIHKKYGDLLPQYQNCTQEEIKNLRKEGVTLKTIESRIIFCYTGDTTFQALLQPGLDFVFSADILVIEVTYLNGNTDAAAKWGHIHISDITINANVFNNKQIILMHISPKYGPWQRVMRLIREHIPPNSVLFDKCAVALRSFNCHKDIVQISSDHEDYCVNCNSGSATTNDAS